MHRKNIVWKWIEVNQLISSWDKNYVYSVNVPYRYFVSELPIKSLYNVSMVANSVHGNNHLKPHESKHYTSFVAWSQYIGMSPHNFCSNHTLFSRRISSCAAVSKVH